ncbi:hypothetical protein ACLB2K_027828 [Fragaria x ananassa]
MGGIFSEKSDVYSFGVLVLEIISYKKNSTFYLCDQQLGFLASAWNLWNEGWALELVDEVLVYEDFQSGLTRIDAFILCIYGTSPLGIGSSSFFFELVSPLLSVPSDSSQRPKKMVKCGLYQCLFPSQYWAGVYNVTSSQPLAQGHTLVSPSQVFELGFFSPNSSAFMYVGLWHKSIFPRKYIWVANREHPLAVIDTLDTLRISRNGNLELVDGKQSSVWSTNVSVSTTGLAAVLLDNGTFVLKDDLGSDLWQSFDYPSDTLLPNMMLGFDSNTGIWNLLTSWKGQNDPSTGAFSFGLSAQMPTQAFIWKNGSTPHWRSGPWDKSKFVGVPEMDTEYLSGFTLNDNVKQGTRYFSYSLYDKTLAFMDISSDGVLQLMISENGENWGLNWAAPVNTCEIYGACGPYGFCKASDPLVCKCLKGFIPKSAEEWSKRIWTGGCVRQTKLSCERQTNTSVSTVGKKDEFWKMVNSKIPDFHEYMASLSDDVNEDCKAQCLSDCSCLAYAYVVNIGCLVWSKDLIDIQEFISGGEDLFIRLAKTDSGNGKRTKLIVSLIAIVFISILGSIVFGWQRFLARKKGDFEYRGNIEVTTTPFESIDTTETSSDTLLEYIREHDRSEQFMYNFDTIFIATNHFSSTNKLGEGGFGPVFKGKLPVGKEIAVKRLSRSSGQGVEEFKNEMLLISKLQHKNLVKIMGCCVTEDEKLLIYEFMENKSLDTLLFDPSRRAELDWARRYVIINGVARGLLYLHHDSCLKGTEKLENTQKVVGTRGYMSPEYAMGGIFSEKSDVYSFGVLVLEIISGRKINCFYYNDQLPSLLAYAWHLWSQDRGLELVDEVLADSYSSSEVMRCLQIGLLCVQDNAVDRPGMPDYSAQLYNITPSNPLAVGETLVSPGSIYEIGFFSLSNSTDRYLGLWHNNIYRRKYVWLANREKPLSVADTSATLRISSNGSLELVDGKQNTVWSTTEVSASNSTSAVAVLLDTGNFVVKDDIGADEFIWQSFDYPCDTMLPGQLLGFDSKSGKRYVLTSWKSDNDPTMGIFLSGLSAETPSQVFVWIDNGSTPYYRSGPWDKSKFIGVVDRDTNWQYLSGYALDDDVKQGTKYLSFYTLVDNISAYTEMSSDGSVRLLNSENGKNWSAVLKLIKNPCDVYGTCGPFGVCRASESPICNCLKGFVPKLRDEWSKGNWSGGCVRQTKLFCDRQTNISVSTTGKIDDGFLKMARSKVPDHHEYRPSFYTFEDCKMLCLKNCSCLAYAYVNTIGCLVWSNYLIDIRVFPSDGEDLYIRLAHSELDGAKPIKLIVSLTAIGFMSLMAAIVFCLYRLRANQKGKKIMKGWSGEGLLEYIGKNDSSELKIYDFDNILVATDGFSIKNKLGQGGFGPVDKGMLPEGKEIAVKRLSSSSGQGVEEFKNEILLISKLQHKNLVRIMGCCVKEDEKLLVYEFMPNKSLDTFLFDPKKRAELDWASRFNIIQGVARGLLYLHHDSYLKIVHRDLKVSNILLDEKMNPKISDFGLARIVEGTQDLKNTQKVVGTRGYISPEYAMGGIYSEKSDVYSFGVLVLEVISSKKTASFYSNHQQLGFLAHAWKLWNEDKGLELVDELVGDSYSSSEDCAEVYSLNASQSLSQGQTLVSPGQVFELGFFIPNGSDYQYVGLWHKNVTSLLQLQTPWLVENRQQCSTAVLLDTGNFVVQDDKGAGLWENFDYPCDTILPSQLLGFNSKSGKRNFLTSWKSESDPSIGIYLVGLTPETPSQVIVWINGSSPHWRSGPWDKSKFIGIPDMDDRYQSGFSLDDNVIQGTKYFSYSLSDSVSYLSSMSKTNSKDFSSLYKAADRPTMPDVVLMLNSDKDGPEPKQPEKPLIDIKIEDFNGIGINIDKAAKKLENKGRIFLLGVDQQI